MLGSVYVAQRKRSKKKPVKKGKKITRKSPKRSRTSTTNTKGDAAWKKLERELARHFGTERAGRGQAGSDTREVPQIENWLELRAPKLALPANEEPWTHVFADAKCRKEILPVVERWHRFTLTNPDGKHLRPVQITGPIKPESGSWVGMCLLEDFPWVYRGFLAPRKAAFQNAAALAAYFWTNRDLRSESQLLLSYFAQAEEAGNNWRTVQSKPDRIHVLPLVYIGYPKRIRSALCFKLPFPGRRVVD